MTGPYETLHIYEINGIVSVPPGAFDHHFLGCWREGLSSFLFFTCESRGQVDSFLTTIPGLCLRSETVLPYEAWEPGDELRPFRIQDIHVFPVWERVERRDGEIAIRLDPGVVFGAGGHPTTRTCIEALQWIYHRDRPLRVLDLGTGTGILAICAAKLGADWVLAVDNNDLALETARKNLELNGVQGKVHLRYGEAIEALHEEADLLVANLHLQAALSLIDSPGFFSRRWVVLSGFLGGEVHTILKELERGHFKVLEALSRDLWFTLIGSTIPP